MTKILVELWLPTVYVAKKLLHTQLHASSSAMCMQVVVTVNKSRFFLIYTRCVQRALYADGMNKRSLPIRGEDGQLWRQMWRIAFAIHVQSIVHPNARLAYSEGIVCIREQKLFCVIRGNGVGSIAWHAAILRLKQKHFCSSLPIMPTARNIGWDARIESIILLYVQTFLQAAPLLEMLSLIKQLLISTRSNQVLIINLI